MLHSCKELLLTDLCYPPLIYRLPVARLCLEKKKVLSKSPTNNISSSKRMDAYT